MFRSSTEDQPTYGLKTQFCVEEKILKATIPSLVGDIFTIIDCGQNHEIDRSVMKDGAD